MENRGTVRRPAALPAHVERLAKALGGVEVVVEERLQPTVKGYIQGNAIHLPPSSPDAAMEILRHELTHRMQELSPRQYGKYRDYVIRQYTAADAAAKYEAYRRAGHPITPEQSAARGIRCGDRLRPCGRQQRPRQFRPLQRGGRSGR